METKPIDEMPECYTCKDTHDLTLTADPYGSELHGDDIERWYCGYCLWQSARDI